MKNNAPPQDFSVSQKIYGRLMLAYPRSHRAEYGAAMAQLFRDQCRDAWSESRTWGLLKLWLRVLPDLVSTSIMERLAALNERKSMTDKLANLFGFRTTSAITFFRVFLVIFLLVFLASAVITFILPESYASTARIEVESNGPVSDAAPHVGASAYDPYFLQTTFEIIQSQVVLNPVIDKLNLNTKWGNKYNGGTPLRTENTMQLLKQRVSLSPERNTKLIDITVYSEDRVEAAQIANAITESYRDYRDKIEAGKLDTLIPKPSMVTIIDTAQPGMRPVRPNKTLNIVLGMVIGILLGLTIGAGAAGVASLFGRRSHGDGPRGKPSIPPETTASRSINDEFRSGSLQRVVGILWMVMSGILCGLGLLALFWVLVNGPKLPDALLVSIFGIFWAGNATASFFLIRGRSWAKICVAVMAAVCWTSGLMMVWSTSTWLPPASNPAVRLLVLQAWHLFAMIFPLPRALQWLFMAFALFTACALLRHHRRSHNGASPAV
jgi:capsular polysaccharide biosynthesis protein